MPHILCTTTDSSGYCDCATLDLTPELALRLLGYQNLLPPLIAHDGAFHGIEFFDDSARWHDDEPLEITEAMEWMVADIDADQLEDLSVAVNTLTVMKTGVLWSASPKHSDGYFETRELSWGVLKEVAAGKNPFTRAGFEGSKRE